MSAVPPEGEFILFHKALKTKSFDPSNKAHFYSNLLVEVVYNDYFDGRWKENDLWLPAHERAEEHKLLSPPIFHAQTRYKYMYVGYGDSPNTQNDHRRLRLWAEFSRGTSLYSGNPPRFVYVVLPLPTKDEKWIWLDLSFPIRAIYIPKAHNARPDLTDRCSYYSLQLAHREVSVPLKYGVPSRTTWDRTTWDKKWYFNQNRQRGWWVWRTPDGTCGNSHPHNLAGYAYDQVQMTAGFDVAKLAVELALLDAKLFDGDYQRIYDDCVQLYRNVKLWHDEFCLNPHVGANMTWNMQNSGPDGTQVASVQFASDFSYKKVEPAWYVEVLKGTIEFGASMVPVVGPILAAGTHMFLELVLDPDAFSVQGNVLGNVAGAAGAIGRMSAIAKPLIRKNVLKQFEKLLAKRRRRVGPAQNRNQGNKSGNQGTETGGGMVGGGLAGTGSGLTKGNDDLEDDTKRIIEDPTCEVDVSSDEESDSVDVDLEYFLKNVWNFFKEQRPDWKDIDLGNLTDETWEDLNNPELKPGDDPSAKTPIPSEPPVQTLLAGSGSDYQLDFRPDGVYLVCMVTDIDDDEHISEIRLDDHIGNQDGNFKWGGEDFSSTAEDVSLEIKGIRFLLSALLLGLDGQYHQGHCIDLVGGIGIQDGELVRLELPTVNTDEAELDDEGEGDDDNQSDNDNQGDDEDNGNSAANRLNLGQTLEYGDRLVSNNGEWVLLFQENGNLVLYNNGEPYWHSNTTNNSSGTGSINARIEEDGNFVVGREGGGRHRWESRSNDYGAMKPYILVQDDGNVCLYDEEVEGCHWAARDI